MNKSSLSVHKKHSPDTTGCNIACAGTVLTHNKHWHAAPPPSLTPESLHMPRQQHQATQQETMNVDNLAQVNSTSTRLIITDSCSLLITYQQGWSDLPTLDTPCAVVFSEKFFASFSHLFTITAMFLYLLNLSSCPTLKNRGDNWDKDYRDKTFPLQWTLNSENGRVISVNPAFYR